jgi:hypothetical protein
MNTNSPSAGAREIAPDRVGPLSGSSLVIDNLDEFAVGIFSCATSSDYAIGSL